MLAIYILRRSQPGVTSPHPVLSGPFPGIPTRDTRTLSPPPAKMPLLPIEHSNAVYKGLWPNYAAPAYRRWIFTATNMEAMLALGFLMALGSFANNNSWVMIRRAVLKLTTPVRLEDEFDIRNKLSRFRAIYSLWHDLKHIGISTTAMQVSGNDEVAKISPWFGIAALINAIGFVVLGIFLPWLLSEGLQGESIVTAGNATYAAPPLVAKVAFEQDIRQTVEDVYRVCEYSPSNVAYWDERYEDIRRDVPIVQKKLLSLNDPLLSSPDYKFITTNMANGSLIWHLSQRVALYLVGINENSNMNIRHQLVCALADLDSLTMREGKEHRIHLSAMNADRYLPPMVDNVTWDISLLTSNQLGSGRILLGSKDPILPNSLLSSTDFILPSVSTIQGGYSALQLDIILSGLGRRFLFIHRATGRGYAAPIDDPFFAAHDEIAASTYVVDGLPGPRNTLFLSDREATALSCVELLDICTPRTDGEYCYTPDEISATRSSAAIPFGMIQSTPWEEKYTLHSLSEYLPVLSIWVHAHLAQRMYEYSKFRLLTWQTLLEEHFVRSTLRLREAYRVAASRELAQYSYWSPGTSVIYKTSLIYRNSDYTNVNFIGFWAVLVCYIAVILSSYFISDEHQRVSFTVHAVTSKIIRNLARIGERLMLLSEYIILAPRRWHAKARQGSRAEAQHELPTRTTAVEIEIDNEPDNPPRMARL